MFYEKTKRSVATMYYVCTYKNSVNTLQRRFKNYTAQFYLRIYIPTDILKFSMQSVPLDKNLLRYSNCSQEFKRPNYKETRESYLIGFIVVPTFTRSDIF